jgi:hypothetical protein
MSTTIKRVALVAVAALSLGVISVAPSQAASQADTLTISSASASQLTGETLTATSTTATLAFLGGSVADTMSVSAFLVSAPAGNTVLPTLRLVETASANVAASAPVVNVAAGTELGQIAYVAASGSTVAASAKFAVYLNGPTKVGSYVIKLTPAVTAGGGVLNAAAQTLTITVAQNPASDTVATSATIILNSGETDTATTDAVVTHPKAASLADAAATIKVSLKNANGSAVTAESYTATVSGPGILAQGTVAGNPTATGRALTVVNGNVVQLFPDGSSGVATVTISSAAGVVLGTKSVTFYGSAATITASSNALTTGSVGKVGTSLNLIKFNVADAAGVNVTTGTYYVVTASTSIANSATYTQCSTYDSTNKYFTCPVTGVAKGTTTLYVTNRSSATDTTTEVKSAAVSIRVGDATAASVSVTTDKSSYAPGEKATLTVTVKDADGNVVPSGDYAAIFATGGITASYTLGSGSDTTTATAALATVDGVKSYTLYLPVTEGDVKFSWTTGTGLATANQGVAGSVTVNVSSVATSAAIDAANEAAQAASDATDAALAAADAADAATTKAQEAVDAVATLSAQVSKLITALKAQITTLTNLVIKIQKKVKA